MFPVGDMGKPLLSMHFMHGRRLLSLLAASHITWLNLLSDIDQAPSANQGGKTLVQTFLEQMMYEGIVRVHGAVFNPYS